MHIQSLGGKWQFREIETGAGPEHSPGEWLPAQVPGSVHTDLLALGRIPDPFVADNELQVQWVAERDWEYRLTFQGLGTGPSMESIPSKVEGLGTGLLAEERIYLVCDGLDTLADVTLNGQPLGRAENMFRQYRWDVTSLLAEGENELRVRFHSPVAYIRPRQEEQPLTSPSQSIPGGSYLRKAPCQFGWDWGPQLPPIGIWQDVRLEGYTAARLDDVHLRQHHERDAGDGRVSVSAGVSVERWQDGDLKVVLRLTAPDGQTQEETRLLRKRSDENLVSEEVLEIEVADPQIWWPNDCGPQPLYDVEVALYQDETLCDRRSFKIGLRTLELRQEADQFGKSFTFVVNGVPIFAKGANWIPADSFPTRLGDEHLEHLIRSAAEAHMNMLRVWGGGLYEEERFYDLCDKYGILVWQDFIFSCSVYPDDEAFVENVRIEAVQNIRRLRHRASLALWCGNNEMEWGWVIWGWNFPENERFKQAYDHMFHHLLPELCGAGDPDRPYWPSSPSSDTPFVGPNSVRAGDTHNWEVWHGNQPFAAYRKHDSRFVSEFGFQSLPPIETVRTYADEADWNMTSYIMEHHQRNAAGNSKIIHYLTDHFRLPRDFESLVYLTQLLQAEAVRTGVEYWRRNRHRTSGTLYWQLNDCWPVASWASLDYYGRWKALHYAARRFHAPLHLSAEASGEASAEVSADGSGDDEDEWRRIRWSLESLEGEVLNTGEVMMSQEAALGLLGGGPPPPAEGWKPTVALYLTNDLTDDWHGTVRWSLETTKGAVLEHGEEPATVTALSAVRVCGLDFGEQVDEGNRREVVLVYELWQDEQRLSVGVIPFASNKHVQLSDPGLGYQVSETDGGFAIEITAQRLARFVWLTLDDPSTTLRTGVVFSDNYFDLPAGRTVTVTLPALDGWTAERVRAALHVRSLVDSF